MVFLRLAIGAVLLGLLLPTPARGVTLNSNTYLSGTDIVITGVEETGDGYIGFFRTDTGDFLNLLFFDEGTDYPWSLVDEFGPEDFASFLTGRYSAVEFVFDGPPDCDAGTYEQCLALSDFRNEFHFDVNTAGGPRVFTPKITAVRPPRILSGTVEIPYQASDEDSPESGHGLAERPVSAFYAAPGSFDWNPWAEDMPATGTLRWDTSRLPEEAGYRLKIAVRGADNDVYQVVFDDISIDNGAPVFRTEFSAAFTRGEPVTIRLESSENLPEPPLATILQADLAATPLALRATGPRTWEGVFRPVPGHDGTARLTLSGRDRAGNRGTLILGADTVTVGLEAPPAPDLAPLPSRLAEARLAAVSGRAVNAAEVSLTVNGASPRTLRPAGDGTFRFEDVALDPGFARGRNVIVVRARDAVGRESAPVIRDVRVNRPPEVRWPTPLHRVTAVNGLVELAWTGTDPNGDPLSYRVEASTDEGRTWRELVRNIIETGWTWDTASFPNGTVIVRITASDGFAEASAQSNRMRLQNNLPTIILEASGNIYFSSPEKSELAGTVRAKEDGLTLLESSWDNGKTWSEILPADGAWDEELEKFAVPLEGARSGQLFLRGRTASGETISNAQNLRVVRDSNRPRLELEESPGDRSRLDMPPLRGSATDADSGVREIQYSIDGGEWLRLPAGSGRNLEFALGHPESLPDGAHTARIRAVDFAGNFSPEMVRSWRSDRTPPHIGSFTLRNATGELIFPNGSGEFEISAGTPLRVRIAIKQAARVFLRAGDKGYPLEEGADGFWSIALTADPGLPFLSVLAEDPLGNRSERAVGKIIEPAPPATGWWQSLKRLFRL